VACFDFPSDYASVHLIIAILLKLKVNFLTLKPKPDGRGSQAASDAVAKAML